MVAISATTTSIMTIKPAKPISTVCFYSSPSRSSQKILDYARQGYILKALSISTSGSSNAHGNEIALIVMEKY